ncbi:MAG: CHAT domain-containing protein, partial [Vicinamibacterales bacterium]
MHTANRDAGAGSGTSPGAPTAPGTRTADRLLQVRVVHGNLAFTRLPVAVGHYSGDSIVSAEKHLDRALHGALAQRLHLGLYPGPIETNAVFGNPRLARDPYARPGGALVVGLGTVGALSAPSLTRSFSRALLEYVLERRKAGTPAGMNDRGGVGIATLLIGTGAGGMSVTDSVFALVRGALQANKALEAAQQSERIAELELIELYEDRAILALEALDRITKRTGFDAGFQLHDQLGTRDGGLQRVSYDDEAPEWWHRLQVVGGAKDADGNSMGLRFAAVTRRARSEVRLLPTQRAVVDQFVRGTLETTRHDAGVGRTLFDLLLPNELKESAPEQDNLVLLLDEDAARYPWELLEDGGDRGGRPFVIDRGLLRQLEANEFRTVVRGTAEMSALVIGDPVSSFVELKGAQAEAMAVSRALTTSRFTTVKTHIRPSSQQVVTALFEQPFKVLHLAGHGVYRYAPPSTGQCESCGHELTEEQAAANVSATAVTGMVIGDGVYLTPGEVAQMRSVPDLVFINCCHLGHVDANKAEATPQEHAFPQLAANLATEFIRMGVRAVVAAGWAVEDRPATTFASTLYGEMLKGQPFGEAIKAARMATYEGHKASNTWGAYQCYGDPDFRLVLAQESAKQDRDPTFLSPAHALRDIGNIAARLKTHSSERHVEEVDRLDRIVKVLDAKKWLRFGSITAALG